MQLYTFIFFGIGYISQQVLNKIRDKSITYSILELRLKEIDETINYVLDEIKHNDLMSENYKKKYDHSKLTQCTKLILKIN